MNLLLSRASLMAACASVAVGCSGQNVTESERVNSDKSVAANTGTLHLVANGEDFVRQGFTSKDGWEITFDRVDVTLADVRAYQADPPFNPEAEGEIKGEAISLLTGQKTVNLAAGNQTTSPILVAESDAPAGQYNAIAWKLVPADSGETAGQSIALQGRATKEGKTIEFAIAFDSKLDYACGEFVGDERKGILAATKTAEVEITFHFDHIFGDAQAPADDDINVDSIGFEPLATLAEKNANTLTIDGATLETRLDRETYQTLEKAIVGLGHTGEGHCQRLN